MPAYPDPTPQWLKSTMDPSVLDSTFTQVIRLLAKALGVDDPASQVMGLMQTGVPTGALDMSGAARMQRAQAMGFRTNMPLYHGSARDITRFDLARGGRTSGSPVGQMGVSTAQHPDVAAEFADLAAARGGSDSGQNILPLVHRTEKPAQIALTGQETNPQIAATLADLWDKGYDAVRLTNYTSPGGQTGQSIVVVKDPAQLRSRFAAFDPAKKTSADLLAQVVAMLGAGGAASQAQPQK